MNKQAKPSTLEDLQNTVVITFHDRLHSFCNTLRFYIKNDGSELTEFNWENFHDDSPYTANLGPINRETLLPILKMMKVVTGMRFIKTEDGKNTTTWTREDYLKTKKPPI